MDLLLIGLVGVLIAIFSWFFLPEEINKQDKRFKIIYWIASPFLGFFYPVVYAIMHLFLNNGNSYQDD